MEPHPDPRHLHVLVHNVSQSDLILSFAPPGDVASARDLCSTFARPLYRYYLDVCERVFENLVTDASGTGGRLLRQLVPADDSGGRGQAAQLLPVGMTIGRPLAIHRETLSYRDEHMSLAASNDESVEITSVYLPLLAVLLPRWLGALNRGGGKPAPPSKKVLFLVSGASVPDDDEHPLGSGSTEGTAVLMLRWLRAAYPEMELAETVRFALEFVLQRRPAARMAETEPLKVRVAARGG